MKLKIISLLLFLSMSTYAQEFKTPLDYLNYIEKETNNISKSTWKYTSAVAHSKSARKIDNTRKALVKTIETAAKKIVTLKNGYNGDTEYRDQILAYLDISKKQINEEYDKIVDMQEVAEQSYDYMEAYIMTRDLVNEKINAEVDKLNANQKAFADKYHIQFSDEETEIGKKMKISNEVFDNHTQLYLIFFKANFTEGNLIKAIDANDLNAIQQNINALNQYADEGLAKLKMIVPYKKDPILVNATKKYLEFCKKEAADFGPDIISFIMLNQKLEESKKTLEAKSEKDRTKAEIDGYNKLVNEVNKGIGNYNKQNNKFNNDRSVAINSWNENGDLFIAKHVPQD